MDNQKRKQGLYTSPEVEVMELKARQVMCTSPLGTERNGSDSNPEDLNW